MKKMNSRLNGFTLMEVIVNISIMMIVIVVSGSMLISGMNIFFANAEALQQKNIADAVTDLISENLIYADEISDSLPENPDDKNIVAFELSDSGQIMMKYSGTDEFYNAFGEQFYNMYSTGYSVRFSSQDYAVIVSYVYDDGGEVVYSSEKSVILMNKPSVALSYTENSPLYISY